MPDDREIFGGAAERAMQPHRQMTGYVANTLKLIGLVGAKSFLTQFIGRQAQSVQFRAVEHGVGNLIAPKTMLNHAVERGPAGFWNMQMNENFGSGRSIAEMRLHTLLY